MKAFNALILMSLMFSLLIIALPIKAQEQLNLTIKPDGSVSPYTNLLERIGTKYTFKDDLFGTITVQTGGITIDGAGHTLQGRGGRSLYLVGPDASHADCRGVLVKNLRICSAELFSVGASNNSFLGNYLDNAGIHLMGSANSIGNLITHNTFRDASIFVDYNRYGLDVITKNNFFNSFIFVDLSDAPIADKNYWSNYTTKYPNAKELEGIWGTPYVNDNPLGSNTSIDYHPLVNPITDFEIPSFSNPNLTPMPTSTPTLTIPTATPVPEFPSWTILLLLSIMVAITGLLVFHKKFNARN
jgi:hypothetical protein